MTGAIAIMLLNQQGRITEEGAAMVLFVLLALAVVALVAWLFGYGDD